MAQLVRIQSSANFYMEHLFTVNCWKDKNKEKEAGNGAFLKIAATLKMQKQN